jgi:hypothetical protein
VTGAGVARAVLALLLTATTTALGVIGVTPTPARAQDDPPDAVRDDGAPRLRLEGQTTWVAPDGRYVVRVRASGDVPDGAVVTADIHEATGSRNEFAQQITGGNLGEVVGQSGSQALPSQGVPRAEVRFATGGEPDATEVDAELDESGVYPVDVRLMVGDVILDRLVTHLVRLPGPASEAPRLQVAVVAPMDSGAGIAPSGRRRADPVGIDRVAALLDALTAHADLALTVVPTPDTVVSLTGTPELGRLRRAIDGRQVVSSQYVPIDLSAWVAAGLDEDISRQTRSSSRPTPSHRWIRPCSPPRWHSPSGCRTPTARWRVPSPRTPRWRPTSTARATRSSTPPICSPTWRCCGSSAPRNHEG